jgi:Poly(ADP-ribose) polymerase catalytic domain
MFVARVLLGNAFICDKIQAFKRPPCAQAGCQKDNCNNKDHPIYNSVIAVNRPEGGKLLFREFVIYDLTQSYPEYLVEYERKP